ncbi:MAG: hypothetical protein K6C40_03950 [Thermoguttaceae bacterium]|nr:hypothetical protein [Thermoguttaceae bacterium]
MFDDLTIFVLASLSLRQTVWAWFSTFIISAVKGMIQGGFFKITQHVYDSYCVMNGKEKKYDICKKDIDLSGKELGTLDWTSLKNPFGPSFSLKLRGTNVTDQDLIDHLVEQKYLRRLDVCNCSGITKKGLKKFKKLRPDCEIVCNWYQFWSTFLNVALIASIVINLILMIF